MERYARQTLLPEIGEEGQLKLKQSRVLIVGVGGLGSAISTYLAAAGIGTLGLIDDDEVSLNNLQRQVIYSEKEIGLSKVEQACKRLHALNHEITIHTYPTRLNEENALELIREYDIVVDGCDNFDTRKCINTACLELQKPYLYGAVAGWQGQVALLGYGPDGVARSYNDLYPTPPSVSSLASPIGILGAAASIIGSLEAAQVVKLICGCGELLMGKLLTVDLYSLEMDIYTF